MKILFCLFLFACSYEVTEIDDSDDIVREVEEIEYTEHEVVPPGNARPKPCVSFVRTSLESNQGFWLPCADPIPYRYEGKPVDGLR